MANLFHRAMKHYFKFNHNGLIKDLNELELRQEKTFQKLKANLEGTDIYNDLDLHNVNNYREYLQKVPVHDFDFFAPYIDRILDGEESVLFHGEPEYFGLTSGTSGKDSKKVPYNPEMINLFKKAQKLTASTLSVNEDGIHFLAAERLSYGSTPTTYEAGGFKFGYISGIISSKTPKMLQKTSFPSQDILDIEDWNDKIDQLINQVLPRDIEIVTGIPTYLITIFETILEKTGKQTIKEIWPNLKAFVYGATPIDQYRDRLNQLAGVELNYYGIYAATEAPLGISYGQAPIGSTQEYVLMPGLLYSFTEVDGSNEVLGVSDLQENKEYFVHISCPNGFVHYNMKDVIKVTSLENTLRFQIIGRKNGGLNLGAEKVSEAQLIQTIVDTKKELNQEIAHFFTSPELVNGKPAYKWTLFIPEGQTIDTEEFSRVIDKNLGINNPDYQDCRDTDVIVAPIVTTASADHLKAYFERYRSKGQFKMKTAFPTTEEFVSFMELNFASVLN